jgi:hypothetical protein
MTRPPEDTEAIGTSQASLSELSNLRLLSSLSVT